MLNIDYSTAVLTRIVIGHQFGCPDLSLAQQAKRYLEQKKLLPEVQTLKFEAESQNVLEFFQNKKDLALVADMEAKEMLKDLGYQF